MGYIILNPRVLINFFLIFLKLFMLKDFAYEEVNMDKKITNIEIVDNLI
jgi:hypothetical protein